MKFATTVVLLFSISAFGSPLIISHRGASFWAPEESRPSYLLAAVLGGDYWEMDIQRTSDGKLVAIHDVTPKRTTNVADVFPGRENDHINKFTWAELQQLTASKGYSRPGFKNVKILSLEQIIDLVSESGYTGGLYVESKNPKEYPGIEQEMLALFREKGWIDSQNRPIKNLVLQSFGKESLLTFHKNAPAIPTTYLFDDEGFFHIFGVIKFAKENGLILGAPKLMFSTPIVKKSLLKSEIPIHGWTIDKVEDMEKAEKLNFAGIFTNRTDLAIQVYKKAPPPDIDALLKALGY